MTSAVQQDGALERKLISGVITLGELSVCQRLWASAGKPSPHAGPCSLSHLCSGPQEQESWVPCWRRSLPILPAHRKGIKLIIPVLHVELILRARPECQNTVQWDICAHLSNFDRRGDRIGDARQRATLPTLGVRDHPALPTLQRDLAKLDPLPTRHTGLGFDDLRPDARDQQVGAGEVTSVRSQTTTHSFGDKLVKPNASLALWRAGLSPHVPLGVAGLLEEVLRLDGLRIKFHSSCRNRRKWSGPTYRGYPTGSSSNKYFTSLSPAASPVRDGLDGSDGFHRSSIHRDTYSGLSHQRLIYLSQIKTY